MVEWARRESFYFRIPEHQGSVVRVLFAGIGWRSVWRLWGCIVRWDRLEFRVEGVGQYSSLGKAEVPCGWSGAV
ncbi:hypothetical protein DPMN_013884 [Dreissena polymorpha]|uniref:Uncharacterized protein n=1 Tax=Dreissena polymorpha TaxID=45954 RepID=A0A9D4N693_DREPO|nr:hypothetical protein DPMN_013884 [Dreissena polymorpha]